MKKPLILCIAFVFVALFAVAASAQGSTEPSPKPKTEEPKKEEPKKEASPLLTKWDVVISAPGQDYTGTLKLEKVGEAYKGSVMTELGEAPLANIKVDGDSFTSNITVNAQGQSLDGTMSGKIKDGKLSGVINLTALGEIPYTGKKS